MVIVSQDKKVVTNFSNIVGIQIEEHTLNSNREKDYELKALTEKRTCNIGIYVTEERAKEVLQDIISRYEAIQLSKMSNKDYGYTLQDYTPVYEMPKK